MNTSIVNEPIGSRANSTFVFKVTIKPTIVERLFLVRNRSELERINIKSRYTLYGLLTLVIGCVQPTGEHRCTILNKPDAIADSTLSFDATTSIHDRSDVRTRQDLALGNMSPSMEPPMSTGFDVTSSDAGVTRDQSLDLISELPPGVYEPGLYSVWTTDHNRWFDTPECVHDMTCVIDAATYDCAITTSCTTRSTCIPCTLSNCEFCQSADQCNLCIDGYRRTDSDQCIVKPTIVDCGNDEVILIAFNLRVHLMRDED